MLNFIKKENDWVTNIIIIFLVDNYKFSAPLISWKSIRIMCKTNLQ